jgi:hypothetical protein
MWERYHAGTKHYFALLKNNRVVWSNASPRKGRLLPGDCTPLVFDWRERKLLCLRELDPDELRRPDLWWFSKNEGLAPQGLVDQRDTDFYRRIIELGRGPSESEIQRWIFSKGITFYQYLTFLWVGDHLFALQWKSEDKVIELYELEFKDSIIEKKRSVTPSEHPCLGAALSPSGDFIALGNIGLFEFSTKDGVGKKRKDLDLIYPAWAPSGKKVVGLGENPEKDKGLYSGTYYNTLKVYPFPANP